MGSIDTWIDKIRNAEKTCIVNNGHRKIHYKFSELEEMVEEYDSTNRLKVRKWRRKTFLGGQGKWEYEVGEPEYNPQSLESDGIHESASNPIFYRLDTEDCFQWKVRNIPYPLTTYIVTANSSDNTLTIKTTNKKYYKMFKIPDLDRCEIKCDNSRLKTDYTNNTLIIQYQKPQEIIEIERQIQHELSKVKAFDDREMSCKPS